MSVITNYILTENKRRKYWKPPLIGGEFTIVGTLNGIPFSQDNARMIKKERIIVEDVEFLLLNKDSDYEAFCEAVKRNIPIIKEWNINGNECNGYYLNGFSKNQEIRIKIASQIGNYIISEKGIEYYVLWKAYSHEFEDRMFDCGIAADDIKFPEKFDWVGGSRCRPRIPGAISE